MGCASFLQFVRKRMDVPVMDKSAIASLATGLEILVDAYACHYWKIKILESDPDLDRRFAKLESLCHSYYVQELGLDPNHIIVVLDGDLYEHKLETKLKRTAVKVIMISNCRISVFARKSLNS